MYVYNTDKRVLITMATNWSSESRHQPQRVHRGSFNSTQNMSSGTSAQTDKYFVGIDVGSGSARAALVSATGQVLATHVVAIRTWNPQPDHYEQSSEDIWRAVCQCVKVSNI